MRLPKAMLAAALAAATFAASPHSASACEFLERLFGCGPSNTTTYALLPTTSCAMPAPVCAPQACAMPVCAPQTSQYMPTTSYQTFYTPVATTVYQPVTAINPCTGCSTVAYRPVSVLTQRAQLVPTTSFSPVCSPCASPCETGGCATCPSGVAPTSWDYSAPAGTGCSTGVGGSTTVVPSAPASPYANPPDVIPSLPPATDPADIQPSINDSSSYRAFAPKSNALTGQSSTLRTPASQQPVTSGRPPQTSPAAPRTISSPPQNGAPTNNGSTDASTDARPNALPMPVLPNPNDRQAMRAVRQVSAYEPIVNVGSLRPVQPVEDDTAWRASNR